MKKTIILTFIMLSTFVLGASAFSGCISNSWEQPQSDSVDLTVSSPVDMVEKEYKIYDYQTGTECDEIYRHESEYLSMFSVEYKDGMLTTEQAASICGNAFETWYPQNFLAGPFYIQSVLYPHSGDKPAYSAKYIEYDKSAFEAGASVIGMPKMEMNCEIDAYTGKITKLNSHDYDIDELDLRDELVFTDELEQHIVNKSIEILEEFGYTGFANYCVHRNPTNATYEMTFTDGQNMAVSIDFSKQSDVLTFESFCLEPNEDNIQMMIECTNTNGKYIAEECGL